MVLVKGKRVFGLLTAVFFLSVVSMLGSMGCGTGAAGNQPETMGTEADNGMQADKEESWEDADKTGETGKTDGTENARKVMGRYVETMNESMVDFAGNGSKLVRLSDGSLMLFSPRSGKWVSKDNGTTWEPESLAWFTEMRAKEDYIMDIAVSVDGTVGIIYCEKESGGETGDGGSGTNGENADNPDGEEDGAVLTETGDLHETAVHPKYRVVSADNQVTEFEVLKEQQGYLWRLCFSGDGRLFGSSIDGNIYEIDWKQGERKPVTQWKDLLYHFTVWGDRIVGISGSGVEIFDMEKGELTEDKVLDDFLETQMGDKMFIATENTLPLIVVPEGDDILYLICEKGIYRHVLGGNVVEQLADGTLNSLGNPFYGLGDGMMLEDNGFLVLFTNGALAGYVYDPDMPATPDVRLKAYSLKEDLKLKSAIAAYQAKHPEVYIRYEIGMDGNGSVTRDDALKKLNMEIAAGKGPDFFLLDDMPMDSYVEKGILADLNPYLEQMDGEKYFQNILRAFESETDAAVYAVPGKFVLPLAGGKKGDVERMTDLAAIAELAKQYRAEKPEGGILGWTRERDMLKQFLWVCAPAWTAKDGSVDAAKLEEFYVQMKKIWDNEAEGITDRMRTETEDFYRMMESEGRTEEELDRYRVNHISWVGDQYLLGEQEFFMGGVESPVTFELAVSYFHVKERSDGEFAPYGGQVSGVFIPQSIAAISRTSEHPEIAAGLLETLLDESSWSGLSPNKEMLQKQLVKNATEDGGSYASTGRTLEDGTMASMELYPSSEEEIGRLLEMINQAHVPYVKNRVLEDAVLKAGETVLEGNMSAEDGVREVLKQVSLYMAE